MMHSRQNIHPKTAVSARRSVPRSLVGDAIGLVEPLRWQVPVLGEAGCSSRGNRLNNQRLSSRWSFDERQALLGNSRVSVHNGIDSPFLRAHARARKRWNKGTVPAHLVADVAAGTALTIFNPSTMVYWIGVTSNWLPFANSIFGSKAPGWRILMAAASLKTWFTTLIVVVQFTPTVSARPSSASSTLSSALSSSASLLSVPWSHPAISCTETQGSGRAPNRRCRKYQVVVMGVSLSSGISMNGPAIR